MKYVYSLFASVFYVLFYFYPNQGLAQCTTPILLPAANYATGTSAQSVATGDFDRNFASDIVVANYNDNTVSVYLDNQNGPYTKVRNYAMGYPTRTIQQVFSNAKDKAGIRKEVGIHSLRHSFATHLLEKGVDIQYIKDLLGHFNIKTTERYLHVSRRELVNIVSPLDDLMNKGAIEW